MPDNIPYDRLGIPGNLVPRLGAGAPAQARLALARGLLPVPPDVQLSVCYVLTMDPEAAVAEAARQSLVSLPLRQVLTALSEKTHPKVLEYLAEFRVQEPELDARLIQLRASNTRGVRLIAQRADTAMCELLVHNHERLLMSPELMLDLHANPACSDAMFELARSFLEMEGELPALPATRRFGAEPEPEPEPEVLRAAAEEDAAPPALLADPSEEVAAALRGALSPALQRALQDGGVAHDALQRQNFAERAATPTLMGTFVFDFEDDPPFDELLLRDLDEDDEVDSEAKKSLVKIVSEMTVAQKLKLAYLGNKESRAILIRERIKSVPIAVIRSGRCTDAEIISFAGDRTLPRDVIREICGSKEFMRKHLVRVALVNNSKTPQQTAISLMKDLNKKELQNLARNKNVSSVITGAAAKLARTREG